MCLKLNPNLRNIVEVVVNRNRKRGRALKGNVQSLAKSNMTAVYKKCGRIELVQTFINQAVGNIFSLHIDE